MASASVFVVSGGGCGGVKSRYPFIYSGINSFCNYLSSYLTDTDLSAEDQPWITEPMLSPGFAFPASLLGNGECKHQQDSGWQELWEECGWSSLFPGQWSCTPPSGKAAKPGEVGKNPGGGSMWWFHKSPAQVARTWGGTSKPRQTRRVSSRFPSQEQNYPCAPGEGIEVTAKPLGLQEASRQDLQRLITTDPTIRGRSQQTTAEQTPLN